MAAGQTRTEASPTGPHPTTDKRSDQAGLAVVTRVSQECGDGSKGLTEAGPRTRTESSWPSGRRVPELNFKLS